MAKTAHNDFATFAKQYREHLAAQIALAESHAELVAALERIAAHPIRTQVAGRADMGLDPIPACQTIAEEALRKAILRRES